MSADGISAVADARITKHTCRHCGLPAPTGAVFCCTGCHAAYDTVRGLGLDAYYARRSLDPALAPPKPDEDAPAIDAASYARDLGNG